MSLSRIKRELDDVETKLGRLARNAEAGSLDGPEMARQLKRLRSTVQDVQRLVRQIS
jgi:archaellum component FlaC